MSKPIIAITSRYDEDRVWQRETYLNCIDQAGGIPVSLPLTGGALEIQDIVDRFDGFLFSGGADIHPGAYGEEVLPQCGGIVPERDRIELPLMAAALRSGKPVLGICRGFQVMNVALGGTLYQDIPTQLPQSKIQHDQEKIPGQSLAEATHTVNLIRSTPLAQLTGREMLEVNSMHHQGVKKLGEGLCAMATANDGIVEAMYLPQLPFAWAVQWHPEWLGMQDDPSAQLFCAFIRACGGEE